MRQRGLSTELDEAAAAAVAHGRGGMLEMASAAAAPVHAFSVSPSMAAEEGVAAAAAAARASRRTPWEEATSAPEGPSLFAYDSGARAGTGPAMRSGQSLRSLSPVTAGWSSGPPREYGGDERPYRLPSPTKVIAHLRGVRPSCACLCRYWPAGLAATPLLVLLYFCLVMEESPARRTWLLGLATYTLVVAFVTGRGVDLAVAVACCVRGRRRPRAAKVFVAKAVVAAALGLVLFLVASLVALGGEDSAAWVQHHMDALLSAPPAGHVLGNTAPPTYIVTAGRNAYRDDLVGALLEYGVPPGEVHFVPAVMANTCKMVGEAGRAEMHRSFLFGVRDFVRNILMGDLCYDSCMFRCFGENFCPPEAGPDQYQTIACQAPPLAEADSHPAVRLAEQQQQQPPAAAVGAGVARTAMDRAAAERAAASAAAATRRGDGGAGAGTGTGTGDANPVATAAGRGTGTVGGDATGSGHPFPHTASASSRRLTEVNDGGSGGGGSDEAMTRTLRSPAASKQEQEQQQRTRAADDAAAAGGGEGEVPAVTSPKVTNAAGVEVIDAQAAGDGLRFDVRVNASNTFLHRADAIRELAVAASHLRAIHAAYVAGEDFALILEDDASLALAPLWHDVGLREAMLALPHDWHTLQLHVWLGGEMGIGANIIDKMLRRLAAGEIVSPRHPVHDAEFWGAVAYVVSRAGMRALLDRYWGGWDAAHGRGFPPKKAMQQQGRGQGPDAMPAYVHRQAVVTPPFEEPSLPFLDLTENPLSDIIVYSSPHAYVVNRPLFSHQLGGGHWTQTHTAGGLHRHEDDRKRLLHFFYSGDDEDGGAGSANTGDARFLFQLSNVWLVRTVHSMVQNVAYFLDPLALLLYVAVAHFCYVPMWFYYQSGYGCCACCCDEQTGAKLDRLPRSLLAAGGACRGGRGQQGRHLARFKYHMSPSTSLTDLTDLPRHRPRGHSA